MEWIDRLNKSLEYVEANLTKEVDIEKAAGIAACSAFHYQRMFTYIAGVPLSVYIRRRRMTAAAFDLTMTDIKIIDLASKYGDDSPTAFNRAFKNVHSVAPTIARKQGVRLTAYPPITFNISIKGEAAMNYKIVEKEAIRMVGVKIEEPMTMEECMIEIPKFWQKINAEGIIPKLCELIEGAEPQGILGVSISEDKMRSDYFISVATSKPCPDGMKEYLTKPGTWAVFEGIGAMPESMQNLQKSIFSDWLPISGYEFGQPINVEVYPEGDQSAADYKCQVWLPIVKK